MELKQGYKQAEAGVIPEDWNVMPLGAICTAVLDCHHSTPVWTRTGAVVIRNQNIRDGKLDLSEPSFTDERHFAERTRRAVPRFGDLVITREAPMGLVCSIPKGLKCCLGQRMVLLRINHDAVDSRYILYALLSESVQRSISVAGGTGSTVSNLRIPVLKELKILAPAKSEQRAIAMVVSDVDTQISSLDQLIAKKRDIKQAAMQQLLTGRHRLPGYAGTWKRKLLKDCVSCPPSYGINAPAVPYSDRLPRYIRITDITEDGRFAPDALVSVKDANAHCYQLSQGDLVFARTGASVGKSYRYTPNDGPLVYAGFLIRIRPDPAILLASFLAAFVSTDTYWNWVRLMSMRSGQPGINGREYGQLPVPLPEIGEQYAIADVLSDMDTELAALERKRDKTRALKQGMMQELLTGRIRLA
ncbi:Restriction endonuclease S subunit [Caballeronia arationis]|uniref:Restriction endonuclease S subunit n=1 Tax=Caballeronia arationis TaxID=1777142 RepID=A0A7Z7IAJ0_9BURK|nr:restriction endonuclease subunit S [Caballeronia arationis]SOE81031.1 Restriction endonuclease S subunit [Caballeronia arationis]